MMLGKTFITSFTDGCPQAGQAYTASAVRFFQRTAAAVMKKYRTANADKKSSGRHAANVTRKDLKLADILRQVALLPTLRVVSNSKSFKTSSPKRWRHILKSN